MMYNIPQRHPDMDATFVKARGNSWGCPAIILFLVVLAILIVPVHALLTAQIGDPAAVWVSLIIFGAGVLGVVFLMVFVERRQKKAQEQAWEREMCS
jgi:hypothetical protein